MGHGLGPGNGNDDQEAKPRDILDMEVMTIVGGSDEGKVKNVFELSSLFELVKEIVCPEICNIKDVTIFEGKGELHFKHFECNDLVGHLGRNAWQTSENKSLLSHLYS